MKERTWNKRSLRQPASALLAGIMAASLLPTAAFAFEAEDISPDMMNIVASAEVQSDPFDFDKAKDADALKKEARSFPASFDLRHCDTDGDGVFENYVTPVKLQNPFGTCWGFGSIAAAEISLLGSGLAQADGYGPVADPENGIKELNLSEKHLTYFTFTALNNRNSIQNGEGLQYSADTTAADRLGSGGMLFYATSLFSSGIGPNLEDRTGLNEGDEDILVYKGKNGFVEFQRSNMTDGSVRLTPVWYSKYDDWSIPEQYRFYASYRFKESYELPSPAGKDEDGTYVYNEAGTNAIKEQLLAKRGVGIAFHADSSMPGQDTEGDKYISENWAHYTWEQLSMNHGVCIVGWDDNYPKENFVAGHQPPADGAWLVKNSWGSAENSEFYNNGYRNWGIRDEDGKATGYFWLSFYDQSLTCPEAFAFDKSNVGHQFYVEQYDYLPIREVSEVTVEKETGMANVFRAEGDSVLSELSFETATPGTEVNYAVFLLDEDFDNPVEGRPVFSGTATYAYGGYHKVTIPNSQQVEMKKGQIFSVAVKEQTPSGLWAYILPQGVSGELLTAMGLTNTPNSIINEKESFFFTDNAWHDMSDKAFLDALVATSDVLGAEDSLTKMGMTIEYHCDNFPIKAYLEPVGEVVDNGIDPDPEKYAEPAYDGKLTLDIGGDTKLYPGSVSDVKARFFGAQDAITDPNQTVTWTSSDPSVFTVEPGAVEQNDGSKKIKAVGLGTAALTADAGPYGKETITVTVEQRKFELVLLDQMEPAYTGQPIQPKPLTVVVSRTADDPMITAVEGKDFKMEYKDNVKCGKAHAILVGIGDYEGVEYTADFTIVPTRSEITGTELQGDTLTVQFASQADSGIDGYELSWRPVGDGSAEPQTMALTPDAVSAEITGLEAGEIYSVSLRAYLAPDPETKALMEQYGMTAEPTFGQASIPAVISACRADAACPMGAFKDINPDAWYHDGVHWALDQGVMNGVGNDRFAPGGDTTRAMVVTMIWRQAAEPESEMHAAFKDVESGSWYARAVDWAAENGIVTGYSDTVFGPDDNVTREQLAVILCRCAGSVSTDDSAVMALILAMFGLIDPDSFYGEEIAVPFDDADAVSDWALSGVNWAWENGILNGRTDTTLAPQDNAARAEVAAMLMRTTAIIDK